LVSEKGGALQLIQQKAQTLVFKKVLGCDLFLFSQETGLLGVIHLREEGFTGTRTRIWLKLPE
jgi:hypothetical protein